MQILEQNVLDHIARYEAGSGEPSVTNADSMIVDAALDSLKKPEERIRVLQGLIRRAENRLHVANIMHATGSMGDSEPLSVEVIVIDYRIKLLRERGGDPGKTLAELQQQQVKCLGQLTKLQLGQYEVGTIQFTTLLDSQLRLLAVTVDSADGTPERIAKLKPLVKATEEIERMATRKVELGRVSEIHRWLAKALSLES
jgi:hypothetical protein